MRLLIAAPGPPTPGGKGYQVRLHEQILRLGARHPVTLVAFGAFADLEPALVAKCRQVVMVPWSARGAAPAAILRAVRLPLSVGVYQHRRMASAIGSLAAAGDHDLALLQLVRMAPYQAQLGGMPAVLDLLDAAALNMRERARVAPLGLRQLFELEANRLEVYELEAIHRAARSVLISRRDLAYLGDPPRTVVVPNGVEVPEPGDQPPRRDPATVMFSGTMSYFPNVDAACWFAGEVFPRVQAQVPAASFQVVGRDPARPVTDLGRLPGVTVTGVVPRVHDRLVRATVAVCPLRLGSGLQTKILEAMAAGTPVVATSKAIEGLPADLVPHLKVADSAADLAAAVVAVLNDPSPALHRAAEGLAGIASRHRWEHSVAELEGCLEQALTEARGRG